MKIVDVDYAGACLFYLVFDDGYSGHVNLKTYLSEAVYKSIGDIQHFSLTKNGSLKWDNIELSAKELRCVVIKGDLYKVESLNDTSMETIIKQAAWDSMQEGRPDILQAAIRAYVEQFGHSNVIAKAGIKSRTSAYRSLKPDTSPSFQTLVQLGNAVIQLAQQEKKA
ncbi:MAG: DUF2442 domain-containing protein [Idiomarina sp.]|nr:DUF2442 domain-containing protein [Idiomarina sp.]